MEGTQVQLWQLVEEYQQDNHLWNLLLESYELLRFHKGYGNAAKACKTMAETLFDPVNARNICGLYDAKQALEDGPCHAATRGDSHGLPTRRFGFLASGFVSGNVALIYGWIDNILYVQYGMYMDDKDSEEYGDNGVVDVQSDSVDYVKPENVPFTALVYAILILGETELRKRGIATDAETAQRSSECLRVDPERS